jgi:biopolymer transport protein ExbB/TolQ
MVVAFTTTIIGLATGTLAYVVAAARQGWVTESIREQRFLAERVAIELGDVVASNELARRVS